MISTGPEVESVAASENRRVQAHILQCVEPTAEGITVFLKSACVRNANAQDYICMLRERLELTGRMRLLVETIRELTDSSKRITKTPRRFRSTLGSLPLRYGR